MTRMTMKPQFVGHFPEKLDGNILYLAMEFATAVHLCACGCGRKVITPFSPTDWKMEFNGETVSLKPSIGNWSFPCRSHYWILNGRVEWAGDMTVDEVKRLRQRDAQFKAHYEESRDTNSTKIQQRESPSEVGKASHQEDEAKQLSMFDKIKAWFKTLIYHFS